MSCRWKGGSVDVLMCVGDDLGERMDITVNRGKSFLIYPGRLPSADFSIHLQDKGYNVKTYRTRNRALPEERSAYPSYIHLGRFQMKQKLYDSSFQAGFKSS